MKKKTHTIDPADEAAAARGQIPLGHAAQLPALRHTVQHSRALVADSERFGLPAAASFAKARLVEGQAVLEAAERGETQERAPWIKAAADAVRLRERADAVSIDREAALKARDDRDYARHVLSRCGVELQQIGLDHSAAVEGALMKDPVLEAATEAELSLWNATAPSALGTVSLASRLRNSIENRASAGDAAVHGELVELLARRRAEGAKPTGLAATGYAERIRQHLEQSVPQARAVWAQGQRARVAQLEAQRRALEAQLAASA